jgi:hypothetical protein
VARLKLWHRRFRSRIFGADYRRLQIDLVDVRTKQELEAANAYIQWVTATKGKRFTPVEIAGLRAMRIRSRKIMQIIKRRNTLTTERNTTCELLVRKSFLMASYQAQTISPLRKRIVSRRSHGEIKKQAVAIAAALSHELIDVGGGSAPDEQREAIFAKAFTEYSVLMQKFALNNPDRSASSAADTNTTKEVITPSVRELNGNGRYHTISGSPSQIEFWKKFDAYGDRLEKFKNHPGFQLSG